MAGRCLDRGLQAAGGLPRVPSANPAYEFLVRQARRVPWWALSVVVHAGALAILSCWPYGSGEQARQERASRVGLIAESAAGALEPIDVALHTPPELPCAFRVDAAYLPLAAAVEPLDTPAEVPLTVPEPGVEWRGPPLAIEPPVFSVFAADAARAGPRGAPSAPASPAAGQAAAARTERGDAQAEGAVTAGLIWLAKAQGADGSWRCSRWEGGDDYDVGVTGLALLAFLGAGHTHEKGPFRAVVRRGLAWLMANQGPDGRFAWRTFDEQGIAALAATQAYAVTGSPQVRRMAQRAVDYIGSVQPEHGGFRYAGAAPREDGDLAVTGWQILALKSAACSGLRVPGQAIERARAFLASTHRGKGASAYLASNERPSPAMTAVGVLCRQLLGGCDAEARAGADSLLRHAEDTGGAGKGRDRLVGDLYFTFFSATALFQMGGEHWARWNRLYRGPLVAAQVRNAGDEPGRYLLGSWEARSDYWGARGGRVYTTAMALLALEVTFRLLPMYMAEASPEASRSELARCPGG